MEILPAAGVYRQQIETLNARLKDLEKKRNWLGWLRLIIILVTALAAFVAFSFSVAVGVLVVTGGIALFLGAVSFDANNQRELSHVRHLLFVNEDETRVLNDQYQHRYGGPEYLPHVHDYANDLDLFGDSSLYQMVNRCQSEQGRDLLARNLLAPLPRKAIEERHEAVKELAPLYTWRQGLQAIMLQTPVTRLTEKRTADWLADPKAHFSQSYWKVILPLYSMVTIGSAAATIMGFIPLQVFGLLFFIYFIAAGRYSKIVAVAYIDLSGIVNEVNVLSQGVRWIEEETFRAPLLRRLVLSVASGNQKAHVQLKELKEILNRFDMRLNWLIFIFLNSFLLWDVRQMRSLNGWKQRNHEQVPQWFRLLAEVEVLCSLATLLANRPAWCLPCLAAEHFTLEAEDIGHPLIPEAARVTSSFTLKGTGKVALVTGSNMAGKSTFLRSLGINTVLAQMGAPVCASRMSVSPVRLMSSMRIADNLAENTSTFYAELKKLKTIIEAVNRYEQVLILLDEILRGTNSLDRHTGSGALIRQLIKEKAVAVIATHDVELSALERQFPQSIDNYHFDVQVAGEELYFDYRLKTGVCTNLNASILMKKIGIRLEE